MSDLRQSPEYARFMEKIGWKVEECRIENVKCKIFIKRLPLLGSFIKICRPGQSPLKQIDQIAKKYRAFAVQINYSPTKTLQLDLTQSEEKIFAQFKKDARYEIRKAEENKILVKKSDDIESFIKIWHKNALRRGFWIPFAREIRSIYKAFGKNAYLILSYLSNLSHPVSGALVLISGPTAYYFSAASTPEGRKLSAPYLIVWEAIKLAKDKGCQIFDFEGIYDERFPQKSWLGFSHFKKSFGGKEVEFSAPFIKFSNPALNFLGHLHTPGV
ncbi:MAG: lipid II:glycine glycyltransferase FemX [Patescibacteria group bacterium]